jgi:NTE family protein
MSQGGNIDELKSLIIDLGRKRVSYSVQLALAKTRFIRATKARNWLNSLIGDTEFRDLRIPFTCVATDIGSGEEVVIKEGSVAKAVRASGSIPVIVPIVRLDGRYLVDGGLVNPVPVSVLRDMGADFIVAVNVTAGGNKKFESTSKKPNIFQIMKQTVHITGYHRVKNSLAGADIVIEPRLPHIRFGDWHRAEESILQGELVTQESIPEIRKRLEI